MLALLGGGGRLGFETGGGATVDGSDGTLPSPDALHLVCLQE